MRTDFSEWGRSPTGSRGASVDFASIWSFILGRKEPPPTDWKDADPPAPATFYSRWAKPPFPPNWGVAEFVANAKAQIEAAHRWLAEAAKESVDAPGYNVTNFPVTIDAVLNYYDGGVLSIMQGVAAGLKPAEALALFEQLRPVLERVVPLLVQAVNVATSKGYALGFSDGWQSGWKARNEDTENWLAWLKRILGVVGPVALGIGAGIVGLLGLVAVAMIARR